MEFWLDRPLNLFRSLNVLPSEDQPYEERLNTLTRLIIVVAIVIYLLKFKGGGYFLLAGVVLIIIIYYSQREMNRTKSDESLKESFKIEPFTTLYNTDTQFYPQNVTRNDEDYVVSAAPQGNVPTLNYPGTESIWYATKYGPTPDRYTKPPVIPPNPRDAKGWGGYNPIVNEARPYYLNENVESVPTFLPGSYSTKISWNAPFASPQGRPSQGEYPAEPRVKKELQRLSHLTFDRPPQEGYPPGGYQQFVDPREQQERERKPYMQGGICYDSSENAIDPVLCREPTKENFSLLFGKEEGESYDNLYQGYRNPYPKGQPKYPPGWQAQPRHSNYEYSYPQGPLQQTPPPTENFGHLYDPVRNNPHQMVPINSADLISKHQEAHSQRNPDTPFQLAVPGKDKRFENNNFYTYRQTHTSNQSYDFTEPLSQDSGLTYLPIDYRTNSYTEERPITWDSNHMSDNLSQSQRMLMPKRFDDGRDLSPYRARSNMGVNDEIYNPNNNGSGDGYRSLYDLPGNNQYYYSNLDPMNNIFISTHKVDHRDLLYPNGTVVPRYESDANIEDYIDQVKDNQIANELMSRENLIAAARNKMNAFEYQYRLAPVSFTSKGPSVG